MSVVALDILLKYRLFHYNKYNVPSKVACSVRTSVLSVFWQTVGWRLTDLRFAIRPGTVSPAVARLHQAGLPLLHLGRTWPPVTLGSLDHCPPPPQLAYRKSDNKKEKNDLFMRTLTGMLKFDLSIVRSMLRSGGQSGQSSWKSLDV